LFYILIVIFSSQESVYVTQLPMVSKTNPNQLVIPPRKPRVDGAGAGGGAGGGAGAGAGGGKFVYGYM
jgi:hypothetical protein